MNVLKISLHLNDTLKCRIHVYMHYSVYILSFLFSFLVYVIQHCFTWFQTHIFISSLLLVAYIALGQITLIQIYCYYCLANSVGQTVILLRQWLGEARAGSLPKLSSDSVPSHALPQQFSHSFYFSFNFFILIFQNLTSLLDSHSFYIGSSDLWFSLSFVQRMNFRGRSSSLCQFAIFSGTRSYQYFLFIDCFSIQ